MSVDFGGLDDAMGGGVLISNAGGANASSNELCLFVEERGEAGGARRHRGSARLVDNSMSNLSLSQARLLCTEHVECQDPA